LGFYACFYKAAAWFFHRVLACILHFYRYLTLFCFELNIFYVLSFAIGSRTGIWPISYYRLISTVNKSVYNTAHILLLSVLFLSVVNSFVFVCFSCKFAKHLLTLIEY